MGKHIHQSFSDNIYKWTSSPSLVHSDIWGSTTYDFKYIVTFVDYYSTCTWIWLMKNQLKLFSIFHTLYNEIKTQFGTWKHAFCNDIQCYYPWHPMVFFIKLCSQTPQEDGAVKWKTHILMKLVRSLYFGVMFHTALGNAFLTTSNLINKILWSSTSLCSFFLIFSLSPRVLYIPTHLVKRNLSSVIQMCLSRISLFSKMLGMFFSLT